MKLSSFLLVKNIFSTVICIALLGVFDFIWLRSYPEPEIYYNNIAFSEVFDTITFVSADKSETCEILIPATAI
jgi:hypothetical protein